METIAYAYGDGNWKDKLTSYNGQAITYDAIGNPLNDGAWTYTLGADKQLWQMSKPCMTLQSTTNYILHGKLVTGLKQGTNTMHFFYDALSCPQMVNFNGALYHYVHNLQGDIAAIVDNEGNKVVEYKYDAWGKKLSVTGNMASLLGVLNPFRYRGYVYDDETELYYLKSRYFSDYIYQRFL